MNDGGEKLDQEQFRLDWGWPSKDLQATESFRPLFNQWTKSSRLSEAFFYGEREGSMRTRESFARALCPDGDQRQFAQSLILSSGAGVGLDLILGEARERSEICFTQSLTYHNALGIMRDRGFRTVPLAETNVHTLDFDKIEEQFRNAPRALCYLVPSYSNPCGESLDIETRRALVTLATRYQVKIISDEVYRFLSFRHQQPQAPFASLDPSGECVVSLGSFTKIAGPGLRLGWLEFGCPVPESAWATRILNQSVFINGGCLNQFSAWAVSQWLDHGGFEAHLAKVRESLTARAEALFGPLDAALRGSDIRFARPEGGYFLWLDLPPELLPQLGEKLDGCGIHVRLSDVFKPRPDVARYGCRLSYSYYAAPDLRRAAFQFIERTLSLIP